MATFQYSQLDTSLPEIRLLILNSASLDLRDSTLEMSLIKTRLGGPVRYKALSYTWGSPQPTYPVLLNGMDFRVQKNLYEALLHFRPTEGGLKLWVDAVCINQGNMPERESQVALMQNIYKDAEDVLVWLGPGDPIKAQGAFSFLCDLSSHELEDITEDLHHAKIPRAETKQWVESEATNDFYVGRWLDVAHLLDSPWFSRMWIIQEVVMGKTVTVVCGSYAAMWDTIYLAGKFIEKHLRVVISETSRFTRRSNLTIEFNQKAAKLSLSAHRIAEIGRLRAIREGILQMGDRDTKVFLPDTVYTVARHYHHFNVTEPRDRVYSLLGILEEYGNNVKCPNINYSIPLVDLYWEIIKPHVEHNGNLDFLSDALGLDRPCGIPSWMPYWHDGDKEKDRATPILGLELAPEITYKATATTLPLCYFNPRLKALRIAGFICSVVRQVGEVHDLPNPNGAADPETIFCIQLECASHIFGKWVSMLDLEDVLGTSLPCQLNMDKPNPTKKEVKAYTFVGLINMIEGFHEWTPEKLFALYERYVQAHSTTQFISAISGQTYLSTRQLAAILHRRLFISASGNFGLGPKTTQPGDMIAFFYGCRVPMILRLINGLRMWRIVGEAYCPYQMNGEMLERDMVDARYNVGLRDELFWIL